MPCSIRFSGPPGSPATPLIASLKVLARLAGQGRSTVAEGIAALERLGLLQRVRQRIRVAWIGGGQASRQVANLYRLMPPDTESGSRPAREQPLLITILEAPVAAQRAAAEALAARRQQFEEALRGTIIPESSRQFSVLCLDNRV